MWVIYILAINAVWDGVSVLSIAMGGVFRPIADAHLKLWLTQEDQNNPSLWLMMAVWTLGLGMARGAVCFWPALWPIASTSYFLEALLAAIGNITGLWEFQRSLFVLVVSVGLGVVVMVA